ncbi:MAG: S46 family peptidase [Gemmatimonadetes bacterium]|nr:S46 family peptidase [Gemmatimonadota bacterium]NIS02883.1 S46 family peptidase [Gemmatimonadota bacterium]NIV22433.1 S46 family peptidase [Gemmatimonadota bacterium]NIW77308.1 S46 family peptidase [Gemmatimonadota bacterium]
MPIEPRSFAGMAVAAWLTVVVCAPAPLLGQTMRVDLDTVRAGKFDFGKMWTFEYPPSDYFTATYGFDADERWFERARLSVLRIPGCSASFVSPNGLVATNHHCVRGAVTRVSRPGESLLDNGYSAAALDEERRIPNYHADQLIHIEDVSGEVFAALDRAAGDAERQRAERETVGAIRTRLKGEYGAAGDSVWVQVVKLYHGGRYSAYVFRRFTDVRLVVAAELQAAFFGGDADNFTYPRYDLDFAFLRIYGADGQPHEPTHHFRWSEEGVEEGDVVFVIGNPGSTNRLRALSQLEYQRAVEVPVRIQFYVSRLAALDAFRQAEPRTAEAMNVRNLMFSLSNSLKARTGQLAALRDPLIMKKKWDAERQLRQAIREDAELNRHYGGLFRRLERIQEAKEELGPSYGAFYAFGSPAFSSATLRRAVAAASYLTALATDAPADTVAARRARLLEIGDFPEPLELGYLTARLADLARYLGPDHAITRLALQGESPAEAAARLIEASPLSNAARTARAVDDGSLSDDDPVVRLATVLMPEYLEYVRTFGELSRDEERLESELGRVRFEVYGRSIPPDGTFSPRITDGKVRGYEYNGTAAPPYTTFFGLYDRYNSHGPGTEWDLPNRWRRPPEGLDLSTPLNFVSTADTYGGNSGSPAVTPELELVGLNFDRNIEGLSRDFIYLPERGRNVMVDVRAIRAALDAVYDADRIVAELASGVLYETEAAADAAR